MRKSGPSSGKFIFAILSKHSDTYECRKPLEDKIQWQFPGVEALKKFIQYDIMTLLVTNPGKSRPKLITLIKLVSKSEELNEKGDSGG